MWNETNYKKNGICNCYNDNETESICNGKGDGYSIKCCKRVTIAIFQSGKIIITGAKEIKQTNDAYDFINKILIKHYRELYKFSINNYNYDNPDITTNKAIDTNKVIDSNKVIDTNEIIDSNKVINTNEVIDSNKVIDTNEVIDSNKVIDTNEVIDSNKVIDNNKVIIDSKLNNINLKSNKKKKIKITIKLKTSD